jgi:hypothetical protein
MKGIYFTIITFVIFLGILVYVNVITGSNMETSRLVTEKISAERIFYTWKAVDDHIEDVLNISVVKDNDTAIINDTLPAIQDIQNFLKLYQQFVNQTFRDPTIDIRFEDYNGNEIDLSTTDPQTLFIIEPMNIEYKYPDYGKNQLFVEVDPSNFSFIEGIDLIIEVSGFFNTSIKPNPKLCPATYCLNLNLEIINETDSWTYPYNQLDIEYSNWITVDIGTQETAIRIETGDINPPSNRVIHVDIIKSGFVINTNMEIDLNTTDFYINLASILNVSTVFGKKVDNL